MYMLLLNIIISIKFQTKNYFNGKIKMYKIQLETESGLLVSAQCFDIDIYGNVDTLKLNIKNKINDDVYPNGGELETLEELVVEKLIERKFYPEL